jgi:glycosyltransferase involved in cell wall biosynthesis
VTTLSACLVVHHEQERIAACLESFADLVDEIVVVHDGPCADETLAIAHRFTDRVFTTVARSGSSEFARPFALEHCTKEWVLVIDADERLSPELRTRLRSLIDEPGVDAYGFSWVYVDAHGRRGARTSMSGKKFLFRRSNMYTIGLPHMTPETYGRSVATSLEVLHVLPERSGRGLFLNLLQKNRRRGRAAAARLAAGIDRVDTFNARLSDDRVKNTRKIRFLTKRPLLALLVIPSYGFWYWYVMQGYWKAGRIGVHDALNLPIYYGSLAFNLLLHRWRREVSAASVSNDQT